MKAAGASGLLADRKIAEALGISEEQAEEIKTRAEKLAVELQRKIEALREETREELLQTLTAEQREKLQKMMGAKYEGELTPQFQLPGRVRQRIERNRESSDNDKPGEGD
jgi:hydroxylamine reductase (hybrid-cluster protein)